MVELDIPQETGYFTFTTRDRFVKAAVHLAKGKKIEELGPERKKWFSQLLFKPVVSADTIRGIVIYVDNYENVITNITEDIFKQAGKGRKFIIEFRGHEITEIKKSYLDENPGEKLALFGSTGHLEIAMNQGNASSLLGLYLEDPVSIRFLD